MLRAALALAAFAACVLGSPFPAAAADGPPENAETVLLVARPGLPDPHFRESVVLVRHDGSGGSAGVIINRPTDRSLAEILPGERFRRFSDPVHYGGPVADTSLVAVYRAAEPVAGSVAMLPGVHLALRASAVDALLHSPPPAIRFFVGYAGWGKNQLFSEIARGDWLVVRADADTVFARDTRGLWNRLLGAARAVTAQR